MKPITTILVAAIISVLAAYGTVKYIAPQNVAETKKQESVYERVMRTGTINCGYLVWPPFFDKDANTGRFSGVFYDLTEAIAKNLSLKVNWKEETGIADFPAALDNNRIDMYCTAIAVLSARARAVDWAGPVIYGAVFGYVRPDDNRFDVDRDKLNDPSTIFSTLDGEGSDVLARTLFPDAKKLQLQQLSSGSQLFLNVINKKADVVLQDDITAQNFLSTNPGTLKRLPGKPIGTFGVGMPIKQGEDRYRQMLDWAIFDLNNTGQMEAVFKKYNLPPNLWLRPIQPYVYSEQK